MANECLEPCHRRESPPSRSKRAVGTDDFTSGFDALAEKQLASKYHPECLRLGCSESSKVMTEVARVKIGVPSSSDDHPASRSGPQLANAEGKGRRTSGRMKKQDCVASEQEPIVGQNSQSGKHAELSWRSESSSKTKHMSEAARTEVASSHVPPDQLVQRDELAELVRNLGYDITEAQPVAVLDMLDPQQQGNIAKDDLLRHILPLLHSSDHPDTSWQGPTIVRRASARKMTRRPRPSTAISGNKSPPCPLGARPATARRSVTSPQPVSLEPGRESSADGLSSPTCPTLQARPPKFWLATSQTDNRGGASSKNKDQANFAEVSSACRLCMQKRCLSSACGTQQMAEEARLRGLNNNNAAHVDAIRGRTKAQIADGVEDGKARNDESVERDIFGAPMRGEGPGAGEGIDEGSHVRLRGDNTGRQSVFEESWVRQSMVGPARRGNRRCSVTSAKTIPASRLNHARSDKHVSDWTAADVRGWLRALPRGLAAFAEAKAFEDDRVDGKRLASLNLSDLRHKDFHHAKFRAKVPAALWVEIKQIQLTTATTAADAAATGPLSSRFSAGQHIVDEATRTPLCTVQRFVGKGAFGEVYEVLWTGLGTDWGAVMAMKTVRLADLSSDKRDEVRVLLMEEILTAVRVKPHPNVVNVRFAHIMGFCTEDEEYLCFEDFVTGKDLGCVIADGKGELYEGTAAEIQGRLLSYSIQLARGLGHIHRCGVLHQDVKSANVLVSNDGRVLITDFGFASIGHFGSHLNSPPMRSQGATLSVAAQQRPYADCTSTEGEARLAAVQGDSAPVATANLSTDPHSIRRENHTSSSRLDLEGICDDANGLQPRYAGDLTSGGNEETTNDPSAFDTLSQQHCPNGALAPALGNPGAVKTPRNAEHLIVKPRVDRFQLVAARTGSASHASEAVTEGRTREQASAEVDAAPNQTFVLLGTLKGFTPRYQSPEIGTIMEEKRKAYDDIVMARGSAAATDAEAETAQTRSGRERMGSGPGSSSTRWQPDVQPGSINVSITHQSDMWAGGVVILELYAGTLAALRAGKGEHACELLETLLKERNPTPAMDEGLEHESIVWHEGGKDVVRVADENGQRPRSSAGGESDTGTRSRRNMLRVEMPEEVSEILRNIFKEQPERRPPSMEAVAACLSRMLARMLESGLAVVPSTVVGAPSPVSLCEESPAHVESEANYAKVGRLHMWLGKALFLRGEDRREQALQEYREGVRVLECSQVDRGSASMALFRWYLGKALLESGEVDEALLHLTEAVAIDSENAKYRHTLGLAKRATGDELGAREELEEAALLDEEDAEDRYQLRMLRKSATKAGISSPPQGEEMAAKTSTTLSNFDTLTAQNMSQTQREALEKASDTRTYALKGLADYHPAVGGVGGSGPLGSDALIPETRRFSVGDKVPCGRNTSLSMNSLAPLSCDPSRDVHGALSGGGDIHNFYKIDSLLTGGQASVGLPGEAYAATAQGKVETADLGTRISPTQSFHVLYMRFDTLKSSSSSPIMATARGAIAYSMPATAKSDGQAMISDEAAAGGFIAETDTSSRSGIRKATPDGDMFEPNASKMPEIPSSRSPNRSVVRPTDGVPEESSSRSTTRSPVGPINRSGDEYVPTLKAVGRAAMVGFHSGLAGSIRDLMWEKIELTLIAESLPSGCFTLRKALCGGLYEEHGIDGVGSGEHKDRAKNVVERMLAMAKQTAAAISHCHRRGVILQDMTPDCVLITPRWKALLRPNYTNAREGNTWSTVSILEPPSAIESTTTSVTWREPAHTRSLPVASSLPRDEGLLYAPFSNATTADYQSPEIAQARKDVEPFPRRSGRALRRSAALLSPEPRYSSSSTLPSQLPPEGSSTHFDNSFPGREGIQGSLEAGNDTGSAEEGGSSTRAGVDHRGGRVTSAGRRRSTAKSGTRARGRGSTGHGEGRDVPLQDTADSRERLIVTPCTSDIWSWALIVLQMFMGGAWAAARGQAGLSALESLLLRKNGVATWSTDDVVSWLREIDMWNDNIEREIRAFKIAGLQLLVPMRRRDVVEKLGLFITDGELASRLWESITEGLQRWTLPPRLANVLRGCLADDPAARFSKMAHVCELIETVTAEGDDSSNSAVLTATSESDGRDEEADRMRTSMILNNIGAALFSKGRVEDAEAYYKMAILASTNVAETRFNLGLLYITPAYDRYREAQHEFETAAEMMDAQDLRRTISFQHARAAERKSNYYQSQEMMKALSGRYTSIALQGSRGRVSLTRGRSASKDADGGKRRASRRSTGTSVNHDAIRSTRSSTGSFSPTQAAITSTKKASS